MTRTLAAILATAILSAPALAASPIVGRWITADGAAVVEVGRCGANVCGRVSRIITVAPGSSATDVNNPLPALRSRSILGLNILTDFTDDGGSWRGRIYDPRKGKTYKSVIVRQSDGTLKVQGCIAIFCQTQVWTRAPGH